MLKYCILLALLSSALHGQEFVPWLGTADTFEAGVDYNYARSSKVETHKGTKHQSLHSNLLKTSFLYTPNRDCDIELEASFAETSWHDPGYDQTKLSFRYLWLNDLVGDCIS